MLTIKNGKILHKKSVCILFCIRSLDTRRNTRATANSYELKKLFDEGLHALLSSPFKEFFIGACTVDTAIGSYLDDAVCNGLYYLVVVAGEDNYTLEITESVVYCGDGFKVEMVGGTVEEDNV